MVELVAVTVTDAVIGALGATAWLAAALGVMGVALAVTGLRLRRLAP